LKIYIFRISILLCSFQERVKSQNLIKFTSFSPFIEYFLVKFKSSILSCNPLLLSQDNLCGASWHIQCFLISFKTWAI